MRDCRPVSVAILWRLSVVVLACSCSRPLQPRSGEPGARPPAALRILVSGDVAGAIEPCGCVKDQLGGIDRFATAVVGAKRGRESLLLEVGALFFPRTPILATERDELAMRAETLADVMRSLQLRAWVPGRADWALGDTTLKNLLTRSGAVMLHASDEPGPGGLPSHAYLLTDIAGVRVGLFGLNSQSTSGVSSSVELTQALRRAAHELAARGANLKIAALDSPLDAVVAAVGAIDSFQLVIVAGSSEHGFGGDSDGSEPRQVGTTLIVEPPNHLRGLRVVDFNVIDGNYAFEDASGLGRDAERAQTVLRIQELSERIEVWKKQSQDRTAIAAREADLKRLRARYDELSKPLTPPKSSYFTVQSQSIGKDLLGQADVKQRLDDLGRRINSSNRDKFSGRKAPPADPATPSFVGVAVCETCHEQATAFWRSTHHAEAYRTLVNKDRQFTLECVGCHVTGYEQPGGSSVTDVELLKDVQCETCHGPGSLHAKSTSLDTIRRIPDRQLCASQCHHSPHVAPTWNVEEAWPKILGEGHGGNAQR